MSKRGLSRRDFLKLSGGIGAGAALSRTFGVPAFIRQMGEPDLSTPEAVGKALQAEGAEVSIHSWGFGGRRFELLEAVGTTITCALSHVALIAREDSVAPAISSLQQTPQ